jgi:hypothetical protein
MWIEHRRVGQVDEFDISTVALRDGELPLFANSLAAIFSKGYKILVI